jgi:hypothetical protein
VGFEIKKYHRRLEGDAVMDENNLRELLEKLHDQIESAQSLDPDSLDQLRHLENDIRNLLERSTGEAVSPEPTVVRRLEESVSLFEVTHPTLATVITDVMVVLGNAGI